tara:strand:- start:8 stop:514 length:507 start_codon:yes stop_codon:yes gene_type:complete
MNIKEPIKSCRKGFTLIELLIVVAIIGILAAVGAAVIPGLLGNAKINASKANHKNAVKFAQTQFLRCMQGEQQVGYKVVNGTTTMASCSDGPVPVHRTGIYEHLNATGFVNSYNNYYAGQQANSESKMPGLGYITVYCENFSGSSGKCIIKSQWKEGEYWIDVVMKEE